MKEIQYANILRKSHVTLIEMLTKELENKKVKTVGYGNRVQHIFVEGKYFMTVDWKLV